MKKKKKQKRRFILRVILRLIAASLIFYAGVVGYVCIREGSASKTLSETEHYDAIIVLGAQVKPDGSPSVQLEWRLDAACEAYTNHPVPVVVCGAQGKDEPMPEADAMKKYLAEKGVPKKHVLTDPDSFNTRQNLKNAADLLKETGSVKSVLIVTSDYHLPRALALAADMGFEAAGLGSPCKPEYWIKNHAREALAWCKYWAVKYLHLPLE